MKNLFQNVFSCHLMIWETDPKYRNTNNKVSLCLDKNQNLNVGDIIIGEFVNNFSNYEVIEILHRRQSSLKDKDYVTIKTLWSSKVPNFFNYNCKTNASFNRRYNLD